MCKSEFLRKSRPGDIHAACQDRSCSVETICKLIDKKGVESLQEKDIYGRVPLYYAIRGHCSFDVIRTIFDLGPDAILQRDFCGDLPLYMLFRPQSDVRILEHVLNAQPKLALFEEKRFSGAQSLFQNLCAQWINIVRKTTTTSSTSLDSLSSRNNDVDDKPCVREFILFRDRVCSDVAMLDRWNKLVLTARAAHFVFHTTKISSTTNNAERVAGLNLSVPGLHQRPKRTIPELHLALQLQCLPSAVLCQFVEMYPEQASMKLSNEVSFQTNHIQIDFEESESKLSIEEDAAISTTSRTLDGLSSIGKMFPLHYFLLHCRGTKTTRVTPRKRPLAASSRSVRSNDTRSVLTSLIRAFPPAASTTFPQISTLPRDDSCPLRQMMTTLPLHIAITISRLSWEEGLRELVYANPSALGVSNGFGTRLVPFLQQTTIGAQRDCDENTALNTTYCLVREDPSVLSTMVDSLSRS